MASNDEMKTTFLSIMTKGKKSNTYKFALARYLLDYSNRPTESLEIPYSDMARSFLEYYWHQECRFKIRQNFEKKKPPHAIQAIREEFGKKYIPQSFKDICKNNPSAVQRAEKKILKNVFGTGTNSNVVPRFQNISYGSGVKNIQIFYKHNDKEQILRLKPEARRFFQDNYFILLKSVILEWAKFLEKINTLPKLIAKIESGERKRSSLRNYVKIFKDMDKCFYCDNRLKRRHTHVDHFIPWSYIYEDEAWNLVLSCASCNSKKSDSLVGKSYLEDLIERNRSYKTIPVLKKSLDNLDVGKGWESELRHSYNNCREYGFSITKSL